jgi:hypothetical protein
LSGTTDLAPTSVLTPLVWQPVSAIVIKIVIEIGFIVGPSGQLPG